MRNNIDPNPVPLFCACGCPLHYRNAIIKRQVQELIDKLGTHINVKIGQRQWSVPRHYIALHGLRVQDLPTLGFTEITGS